MERLALCLRYYIVERMQSSPGWKGLKVILSDASVPGEGEHKVHHHSLSYTNVRLWTLSEDNVTRPPTTPTPVTSSMVSMQI